MKTVYFIVILITYNSFIYAHQEIIMNNSITSIIYRPAGTNDSNNNQSMDNIAPNTDMLGFDIGDLAGLAPIVLSMFCFNAEPKLTMVSLTALLLFILSIRSNHLNHTELNHHGDISEQNNNIVI